MCKDQWKIDVGDQSHLHNDYPGDHWSYIVIDCCERDMIATLYRRTIIDNGEEYIADWWPDGLPSGWMFLRRPNQVITSWDVLADTTPRNTILIGEIQPETAEGIVARAKRLAQC